MFGAQSDLLPKNDLLRHVVGWSWLVTVSENSCPILGLDAVDILILSDAALR